MGIKLTATFVGRKRHERRLERAGRKIEPEMRKRLLQAGELVAGQAKKEMHGSRSRARRMGRPVTAPRGVLGIDTGRLRQSIGVRGVAGRRRFTVEVGTNVEYARVHELGGIAGGVRIAKRPYLQPAMKKMRQKVIALTGRVFKVATK